MLLDQRVHTFLVLCETMNFTRASERLFVTQPTVSQQIKSLEEECNKKLFSYEGKKLQLTPAGELLRKQSVTMFNDALLLKKQLDALDTKTLPITFGATMTIGEYVIPKAFALYLKAHSDVRLSMHIGNTQELIKKLFDGEINFALVEGSFQKNDFDYMVFDNVPFIMVCHKHHKFKKKVTKLDDLFEETLLVREKGSGTRNILESQLSMSNFKIENFSRIIQVTGMHAILKMLEADLGISFMYKSAACELLKAGILKEEKLKDFKVHHEFTYIWQKHSAYSELYKEICVKLREYSLPDLC